MEAKRPVLLMSDIDARVQSTQLLTASATASELGVSVNMLRRYAKALEEIEGPGVIRTHPQQGRLYTSEQVELLKKAREFVMVNPGTSVEAALRAAMGRDEVIIKAPSMRSESPAAQEAVRAALTEVLTPLVEELQSLRREVAALREAQKALPSSGDEMQERQAAVIESLVMEIGTLNERMEAQSEQLKALTPPSGAQSGKAEYVAEMEQIHTNKDLKEEQKRVKELNRRIEYLQRELERRNNQAQEVKRPWWRRLFG